MDKTKIAKNQKLFGIAAIAFLSIGIVHVGYKALEISAHEEWGMPWHFAFFSPGLVYVIPINRVCHRLFLLLERTEEKRRRIIKSILKFTSALSGKVSLAPTYPTKQIICNRKFC